MALMESISGRKARVGELKGLVEVHREIKHEYAAIISQRFEDNELSSQGYQIERNNNSLYFYIKEGVFPEDEEFKGRFLRGIHGFSTIAEGDSIPRECEAYMDLSIGGASSQVFHETSTGSQLKVIAVRGEL